MNNLLAVEFSFDLVCIAILAIGFFISIIGTFANSFTNYGIASILLYITTLIIQVIIGTKLEAILYLLVIILLEFIYICVVGIRNVRFGKVVNSVWIQSATAVPQQFEQKNTDLINKIGFTISDCKPIGKIKINNIEYDAISDGIFIKRNVRIKVVKIEDNLIYIKEC